MSIGICAALTYLALFSLLILIVRTPGDAQWLRLHRAAWTVAWLTVAFDGLASGTIHLELGWLVYLWSALLLAAFKKRPARAGLAIFVMVCVAFWPSLANGGAAALALLLSCWLLKSSEVRWALRARTLVYWCCFASTFFILLPYELSQRYPHSLPLSRDLRFCAALLLLTVGIWIARHSTQALTNASGTPDPTDAPPKLCTTGIYAHLRHPMQIAHALIAFSSALVFGTLTALIYAIGFTTTLLTFHRWIEEQKLVEKFGQSYLEYRSRTPALVPFRCFGNLTAWRRSLQHSRARPT